MGDFNFQEIAGVSFEALFGANDGDISMERVEAFLDKLTDIAAQEARIRPNTLVRVIHNGRVLWMTQEQASNFLNDPNKEDLRKDVESALKGKLQHIRQELEVLLAIAIYTFEQFKKNDLIPTDEVNRLEPGFQRRQQEIKEGVTQTAECEALVEEKRRRNPAIEEFEILMGQFLQAKSHGEMRDAADLARQLANRKKQYVLATRALEPDVRTIYYHRLSLQKTKKRLLHTQNDLCSTRKDSLVLELNDLENSLKLIRKQTEEAECEGQDTAAMTIDRMRLYDEETVDKEIKTRVGELEALKKETAIIERQEKQVDSVIQTISETVLGESDTKIDIKQTLSKESLKMKSPSSSPSSDSNVKRKGRRMHFHRDD